MKIIRVNPEAELAAGEKLMRILAFMSGAYALHKKDVHGRSVLDLYDAKGSLITKNIPAQSAYVLENGNYFLLYEPTNQLVGYERLRRKYRLLTKKGLLVYDDVDYFTPLADGWFTMLRNNKKFLCNENGNVIAKGFYDYQKFDSGFAKIKRLPNNRSEWTIYSLQNKELNRFDNGIALLKSGVMITEGPGKEPCLIFPDGKIGCAVSSLFSGQKKNIACLTELVKKGEYKINCYISRSNALCKLELADVYEFENGNFTAFNPKSKTLGFYPEGADKPLIETAHLDFMFAPSGAYLDPAAGTLSTPDGTEVEHNLIGLTDYGYWYTADRGDGSQTLFLQNGKLLLKETRVTNTVGGLIIASTKNGMAHIFDKNGTNLLPSALPLESLRIATGAF